MTLRILICDDHATVRAGLATAMRLETDLDVVGEAHDGPSAVERATELRPDVVVLDYKLPGLNGREATERIVASSADIKVLLLTGYDDEYLLRAALASGATGFILKSATVEELMSAVRAVARGETYIDPRMVKHLVKGLGATPEAEGAKPLSARESEVLRLTATGLAMKEISAKMNLGARTIETYKARGMEKLGLTTRAELMVHALANDWLRHL